MFRPYIISLFLTAFFSTINAEEIDIAIIGGGVTGTYTGWKLSHEEKANPQNIHLFEATDRIGGRLYTVFFPDMKNIPVELGGMRFRESHTHVHRLANELGLTIVPFVGGDTDNLYYLRGVRLRKSELTDPSKLPYTLAENEQGKSPSAIMMNAINEIVPNAQNLTKEEWHAVRDTLTYKGQLLKDVSWINFLTSTLSSEAFQFLSDVGDIYLMSDVSALSQLNLWIGTSSGRVYKIAEGYQSIPLKLREQFEELGGRVHTSHKLIAISNANGTYQLTFSTGTGETTYFSKKVILTLAPTALLELLPHTPFAGNSELIQNLKSVSPNTLTKLFLAYPNPWWRTLNLKEGNSGTSLPIRGTYYFPSEEDFSPEGDNKNALILASYQGSFTSFWRSLNNSKPFKQGVVAFPQELIPGENVVAQAHHQLKQLHGMSDIPEPMMAAFQDWGQAPYYGAFYFWNVGADPTVVEKNVRKPLSDNDIYIFTAEFGEEQGWVEYTLETSDRLLNEHFGID